MATGEQDQTVFQRRAELAVHVHLYLFNILSYWRSTSHLMSALVYRLQTL